MAPDAGESRTHGTRGLTGGDAVAVLALLAFVLAWVAGWAVVLSGAESDVEDVSDFTIAVTLFAIIGPAAWAGHLVTVVIGGGDE